MDGGVHTLLVSDARHCKDSRRVSIVLWRDELGRATSHYLRRDNVRKALHLVCHLRENRAHDVDALIGNGIDAIHAFQAGSLVFFRIVGRAIVSVIKDYLAIGLNLLIDKVENLTVNK